ncbi:MAG TPA: MlaD family protein [Candidatus Acidoferrum sp.]|nr:MlaD family protein [Candidatus Acidoferrum sp.]
MKIRLNPVILGAFIIGAIAIIVIAFLALSSTNIFQATGRFVIYLPNSAQGVNAGTSVSLQGVRLGQVGQVDVLYDQRTRNSMVRLVCEITENRLNDARGRHINLTRPDTIRRLVGQGMFAQIQTAGVVGAKYIELGFQPKSHPSTPPDMPPSPYPVVPTIPATMSELTENISGILANIHKMDFPGISKQLEGVLASARDQLGEMQTNRLTSNISSAAQSIDRFASSAELRDAVGRIRTAAAGLQTLVTNLNTQVQPLATNLDATLAAAGQTVRGARNLLSGRNELGQELQDVLNQLDRTARAIEELAQFLDRHPNALITGRANPNAPP